VAISYNAVDRVICSVGVSTQIVHDGMENVHGQFGTCTMLYSHAQLYRLFMCFTNGLHHFCCNLIVFFSFDLDL